MPSNLEILIVDDDVEMLNFLTQKFKAHGFETTTASSGGGASKTAGNKKFDAVLSDIRESDGDGLEVLKRMVSQDPDAQVFLFTGDLTYDRKFALALGAKELFRKPVNVVEIVSEIKNSLKLREFQQATSIVSM